MLQIHRKQGKIVKGLHYVYTRQEADDAGIEYMHWMHGRVGDWVVSDDDYVLQVLETKEYYDSRRSKISRYDVHTIFYWFACARCTIWSSKFYVTKHLKGMNHIGGKTWQEGFVVSRTGRRWLKLAAMMFFQKTVDLQILGEQLGFDRRYPDSVEIMVKRYLRDPLIENAIFIQMSEFLNKKGITFDQVLDEYKEILKKAKDDGKYSDALKILEKFERWTGLNDKINGDKIEHAAGHDLVGQHIEKMLEERLKPKELPGGKRGMKVSASHSAQVTDENNERVEYIEVSESEHS